MKEKMTERVSLVMTPKERRFLDAYREEKDISEGRALRDAIKALQTAHRFSRVPLFRRLVADRRLSVGEVDGEDE